LRTKTAVPCWTARVVDYDMTLVAAIEMLLKERQMGYFTDTVVHGRVFPWRSDGAALHRPRPCSSLVQSSWHVGTLELLKNTPLRSVAGQRCRDLRNLSQEIFLHLFQPYFLLFFPLTVLQRPGSFAILEDTQYIFPISSLGLLTLHLYHGNPPSD